MKSFLPRILLGVITLCIIGAGCIFGMYLWASKDLPSISKVQDYRPSLVTTVYARDGSIMGQFYREKRFLINLEQMPAHLPKAFLAAEDATFYSHPGINFKAILRAFIANVKSGDHSQGGSTITQQVVKRLVLTPEKSYKRKAQEALLAYQLEDRLDKDQILYIYLNQIFLGNNAYGVEAAARTYFAKTAAELTLAESAVLASLPKAPSAVNPYRHPEAARDRQRWVLGQMEEKGFITKEEHEAAVAQPLIYKNMPDPSWNTGAWYLEEVRRQLIDNYLSEQNIKQRGIALDMYGEDAVYSAGLNVYTAMDPFHQQSAENALRYGLHEACKRRGWRGAITNLPISEREHFLKENPFTPQLLGDAGWVKALVTKVTKAGAEVRLGRTHKGFVSVATMGWCRTPNTNVSPENLPRVTDAAKVLTEGDVIWVSAVGAVGDKNPVSVPADPDRKSNPIPPYDPATVTPQQPVALCLEQWPDLQGAVASIDIGPGDLVAIAGGYAFSPESQFNRATQAHRQPGSSFKPIVYSAALDHGFTAGSILLDSPFVLPVGQGDKMWKPGNFDGKFLGPILLRTALAKSRNVCTVRVAQAVGMDAIVERAHALGITGNIPPVLAVSLGSYEATPLNMAEAYTAFANGGTYIKPRIITSVSNSWNETLFQVAPDIRKDAISPQNAYIMATLLKEVVNAGTASRARVLGRPVAGKTGTSNDERDAWFIGFSPYLVSSVYVGYDNNTPMGRMETGGKAALPIFIKYRQAVDRLYPPTDFPRPDGVVNMTIDANTGYMAGQGSTESYSLPFIAGTEPRLSDGRPTGPEHDDVHNAEDLLKQF